MASKRTAAGKTLETAPPAGEGDVPVIPAGAVEAYANGTMDPADAAELEADVRAGIVALPAGFTLNQEKGFLDKAAGAIKEAVTGSERRTAQTEGASDITMSPQFQALARGPSGPTIEPAADALGTLKNAGRATLYALGGPIGISPVVEALQRMGAETASPREQMAMIAAANPDLKIQTDEKGNQFFVDPASGRRFSELPGLRVTDIPRVVAQGAAFLPAGGVAGVGRAALAGAATQAALEGSQAVQGGEINPLEIGMAAVGQAAGPALGALRRGGQAAANVAEEVVPVAAGAAAPMEGQALGALMRDAAAGNKAAQASLAAQAAVDQEAAKAAVDLGIDVPVDILADNKQIRDIAGLVRSKIGSAQRADLDVVEEQVAKKADELLGQFDAAFIEGRPSAGGVSEKVLQGIESARDAAKAQASKLFTQIDNALPPSTPVEMGGVAEVLNKRIAEYGGDVAKLTAQERALYDLATNPKTTYRALMDQKAAIQKSLRNEMAQGPYAGMDRRLLTQLESALKNDQMAAAEAVGGAALKRTLTQANRLTALQKGFEARAVEAFGKDLQGDLAPLMKRAIEGASSDANRNLKRLVRIVPPENRKEVLATALASMTRGSGAMTSQGFSPNAFVKLYPKLRSNREAYGTIAKELGPEADKALSALYALSKKIVEAKGATPRTGQSLQALEALEAPGLLGKLLQTTAGKAIATVGAVKATGGLGAVGVDMLSQALAKGSGKTLDAAAALMRDPDFARLAISGAKDATMLRKVSRSERARAFMKAAGLPTKPSDIEAWMTAASQGARSGTAAVMEQANGR